MTPVGIRREERVLEDECEGEFDWLFEREGCGVVLCERGVNGVPTKAE